MLCTSYLEKRHRQVCRLEFARCKGLSIVLLLTTLLLEVIRLPLPAAIVAIGLKHLSAARTTKFQAPGMDEAGLGWPVTIGDMLVHINRALF